ncbi:hypothetical protein IFM53868_05459 [Aspergillus udagawae]|uniref:Uncharacterized protein n=1 Tax=Aspergillus udagawae TaxID=91492 RepID=A0ABQ1AUJ5_9EURO|nr:hypothetical protein IFM53868_05459 [Aspergillus udagawae]
MPQSSQTHGWKRPPSLLLPPPPGPASPDASTLGRLSHHLAGVELLSGWFCLFVISTRPILLLGDIELFISHKRTAVYKLFGWRIYLA